MTTPAPKDRKAAAAKAWETRRKNGNVSTKKKSITKKKSATGKAALNKKVVARKSKVMSHNVGSSDYSKHKIQPWEIWDEYNLDAWDADIIKRVLRTKAGEDATLDYKKIIHVCEKQIERIKSGKK